MEIDFRKKKKVSHEEVAEKNACKEYEEDAQAYYKSLRARQEQDRAQKEVQKKKTTEEKQEKKKEREIYYKEIRAIYRKKGKKK